MKKSSIKKTRLALIACATSMVCLGVSTALAGEITGNGKVLKDSEGNLNGRSQCAFSGRQDNYEEDAGFFKNMLVQSWGQIPKELRDFLQSIGELPHPGIACNPAKSNGQEP